MARPKALTCDATVNGMLPAGSLTVVDVRWFGAAKLGYDIAQEQKAACDNILGQG